MMPSTPTPVAGLGSGVAAVSVGVGHVCALMTSGAIQCWGSNNSGQLGNGTLTDSTTPVTVLGLSAGATAVAAGYEHTCAVLTTGAVQCWGLNTEGGLGNGTKNTSSLPVQVVGITSGATAVACGNFFSCALMASGSIECWGDGGNGELGDGGWTPSTTPVGVSGITTATSITLGDLTGCAMTSSGPQCWGDNATGELGNGSTMTLAYTPVAVSVPAGVTTVALGAYSGCSVTQTGGGLCWGQNYYGQLGSGGPTSNSNVPVNVYEP
jgi:alpha-tubulin suppressor-like RCC1 family protein